MREDGASTGYPTIGGPRGASRFSHTSRAEESATRGVRLAILATAVLRDLGVDDAQATAARAQARRNGTHLAAELLASGRIEENALARAIAGALRQPTGPIPDGEPLARGPGDAPGMPTVLRTAGPRLLPRLYVAPKIEELAVMESVLARGSDARSRTHVTTASEIRRRLALETAGQRSAAAELSLSAHRPDQSARQVVTGAQGAFLATVVILVLALAFRSQTWLLVLLHLFSAVFFLAPTAFRVAAAVEMRRRPQGGPLLSLPDDIDAPHPTYSVLVALRQEEDVVAGLVRSLAELRWPRSRLEVMLVCEEDDPRTIAAARAAVAGEPGFALVVVPVSSPRTKPKALNFALPLATGEFVALFDAEDRPDPGQLEAAWRVFAADDATADGRLACVQATLVVDNAGANWLAGMFALEYATLFRAFLPWLASHGLPLPLGGTSNHFRRSALVAAGGWDSHNVTEDADLGMRLCRDGYRVGTLASPTYEDAPTNWRVWRNQRTRWMKGWLQTYLVHMRDPPALLRDLGPKGFAAFQVLFCGMILATFAHPLFLVCLGWACWRIAIDGAPDLWVGSLLLLDLVNLVGGYVAVSMLAAGALDAREKKGFASRILSLYPYWFLISYAALRAFIELWTRPHHWAKTPHRVRQVPAEPTGPSAPRLRTPAGIDEAHPASTHRVA